MSPVRQLAVITAVSLPLLAATTSSLPEAVRQRDEATVQKLLKAHADVNAAQPDGTRALHWAAEQDNVTLADSLIRAGADVKAANQYGVTPLTIACTNGNVAMVKLLIKAGADPNTVLPGGETALMTASRAGNVDVVRALLVNGAKVDAKEPRRGQTAIMWAAAEGHVPVVEALIEAGADFRARLESGYSPFLFAVREGRLDMVKALLKAGADVNDTIPPRKLLTKTTGQNHGGPAGGSSALHIAVTNGHLNLAAYLLDQGANAKADGPGWAPIHILTWIRKPGGGDNDPAPIGSGTLGTLEFLKILVAHGADVNARMARKVSVGLTSLNTTGATTYLLAARTGDAELMRALVKLGADPNIPNADGSNAFIVGGGLGTRSPGEDAGTDAEVVEALQAAYDHGVNINAVDKNGETAMHGAAYKNLPGAVLFIAAHGADPKVWNQKNSHGWTPLTIAEGYRFGNFKPSPPTIEAFHTVMNKLGLPIVVDIPVDQEKNSDYAPKPPAPPSAR